MDEREQIQESEIEQYEGLINTIPKTFKSNDGGIRGFILTIGDGLMSFTVVLSMILLVIYSLMTIFADGFLDGIITLFVGLIAITLLSYTIFCIIDARYNLKRIAENTTKLLELNKK